MNEEQIKAGFLGVQRGHGKEVHSIKSLANRLLSTRQTIRKSLANKELHFERVIDHGKSVAFEFSSTYLDDQRRAMVDEICSRVRAETKRLTPNEHEILLTQLHASRGVKKDVETEFAQPSDDEDDNTVASLLGKTAIGGSIGAGIVGGALGVNSLRKRGQALNEAGTPANIATGADAVEGASKGLIGDASTGIADAFKTLLKRFPKAAVE